MQLTFVETYEFRVFCKAFIKEYKCIGLVFAILFYPLKMGW